MNLLRPYTCFLLLCVGLLQPLFAQNLVPNPGFELGHDVDHELVAINGSEVVFLGVSGDGIQGDSALQIDIGMVGTGGPQVIGIRHQISGLDPLKTYRARVVVKGPVGQEFRFRLAGDGKQTMNFKLSSSRFKVYNFDINPLQPSASGSHLFALEFAFTSNTASTWVVDSLVLEETGGVGPGPGPGTLARAFVSPEGLDSNPGTMEEPLLTLLKAVEMLAGDTIYMLEGSYQQEAFFSGFSGSSDAHRVIIAYPGHEVVLDGSMEIESPWVPHQGAIYKTTINRDIWQLFVNGEMMNLARWPNVDGYIEDVQPEQPDPLTGSLWDQKGTWGHSASTSSNGVMIDDGGQGLAASGLDMSGAIAVLNVGSFKTSAAPVSSHVAGQDFFEWDPSYTDPWLSWQKPDHSYYYLEGKLELLDRPGEWYYDAGTKELYLMTKDGIHPDSAEIRGKEQSYAMVFDKCSYLTIRDIAFSATTLSGKDCNNLTIENCTFSYPSCSKRMLGDYSANDITIFEGDCHHIQLINNVFQYSEGEAFYLNGSDHLMENNLIRHIDFSCVNLYRIGGTIDFIGDNNILRNNTFYIAGASETITPGTDNIVEGNEVWGIGHLQNDGAMIQYMVGPAVGSITRYNWLHDCTKMGMRYDGSLDMGNTGVQGVWDPWGNQTKGMVYGNVIWNCPTGLMIKGDYHVIINNTVFSNEKVGIIMMNPTPDGANPNSLCKNNVAEMISGFRGGKTPDEYPIPGDHNHNWNGYYQEEEVGEILNDILNRDFRPVSRDLLIEKGTAEVNSVDLFPEHAFIDSVYDIGAYEHGDTIYHIAGRREALCSHPVPADGGVTNSEDVLLAWRPAFRASSFRVYVGESLQAVRDAGLESPEFRVEVEYNTYIPDPLYRGDQIFWRVDALVDGTYLKGKPWSFTAGANANGVIEDTLSKVTFIVSSAGLPVEGASVSLNGSSGWTGIDGVVVFDSVLHDGPYDYLVEKEDFIELSGRVLVDKDTVLYLEMDIETGTNTTESKKIKVYPNPASDQLYLDGAGEHDDVEIVDMYGRLVFSIKGSSAHMPVNVSHLPEGGYILSVHRDSEMSEWLRIMIVR